MIPQLFRLVDLAAFRLHVSFSACFTVFTPFPLLHRLLNVFHCLLDDSPFWSRMRVDTLSNQHLAWIPWVDEEAGKGSNNKKGDQHDA